MKLIDQSHEIIQAPIFPAGMIERCGRTCYKSEDKMTNDGVSSRKFIEMVMKRGHESVIEHVSATVKFITNRGVTHELVRHRLAAYSQESTRYCNYGGNDIIFIRPVWCNSLTTGIYGREYISENANSFEYPSYLFITSCFEAERQYNYLLSAGWRPEQAREILPNALKTEIIMTANFREWRHVFNLRCSMSAHPQIRALMQGCLKEFLALWPVFFEDLLLKKEATK